MAEVNKDQFQCHASCKILFFFLYRKIIPSSGPLDGTTSSSPCLTPTFSGSGMVFFNHFLILASCHTWIKLWPLRVLSSIMNSLVIVLFLSGMVAMIMLRTLHKDIARYNQVDQVRLVLSVSRCKKQLICFQFIFFSVQNDPFVFMNWPLFFSTHDDENNTF